MAFQDEIGRLNAPATFTPYPAGDYGNDLSKAAHQAFVDVNANGGVLVAAGAKAAGLLQNETTANPDIPIILAFGGEVPDNAGSNMTGFIGNTIKAARHHLKRLKHKGHAVTVMHDPDANNEATQKVLKALKAADPTLTPLPKAPDHIATLKSASLTTAGFMLIPNAGYYENYKTIVDAVDGANVVKMAYYPEIEYLRHHKRKIANVHGHNVPLTFRLAANWVNHLLHKDWDVNSMPDFAEAITEDVE
jgi:hypothetical protein